jgi:hypothetical protein
MSTATTIRNLVTSITGERFSFNQIFWYDWDIPIDISDNQFTGKEIFVFCGKLS